MSHPSQRNGYTRNMISIFSKVRRRERLTNSLVLQRGHLGMESFREPYGENI
jgi:hypothetical protein